VNHANILKYDNRPFATVEEHDQVLLDNWNAIVGEADTVYVLGDFCLHSNADNARKWVAQLSGTIYLVYGNHNNIDREIIQDGTVFLNSFALGRHYDVKPSGRRSKIRLLPAEYVLRVPDLDAPDYVQSVMLSHYAHRVWNGSGRGVWHLYGHSHGNLPDDPNMFSMDVSTNVWGYKPVSYKEVKAFMAKKTSERSNHLGRLMMEIQDGLREINVK
jgi:calcineurin-like phosphoesterase family protein